jgi:predicted nucleic acid-binding protein
MGQMTWGGLNVLDATPAEAIIRDAADLIDTNPLAPRDAFHLAVLLRHRVPALVTADSDFDAVQLPQGRDLTVVKL